MSYNSSVSEVKLPFGQTASLFLVLIIDAMGMGLVLPLLGPLFMEPSSGLLYAGDTTVIRDIWYSLVVASFSFFMLFGAPFLGDLSDHLGRKKVLLLCLYGTAFGCFLSALGIIIRSLTLLIAGRAIAGFMCGSQSLAQAAIVDMSAASKKVVHLSLISFASCLGFILGPYMAGWLAAPSIVLYYGFTLPFIVAGLLAFANASALIFTFKETFFSKAERKMYLMKGWDIFISAFSNAKVRKLTVIYLLAETGWSLYFQFMPLHLINAFEYESVQIGHFMAYMGVLFALALLGIIRIASKLFSTKELTCYSLLLTAFGVILAMFNNELLIWFSAIPASIGGALYYVALLTLFSNAVDAQSQGWVMGVFAAAAAFSWALSGFLIGAFSMFGMYTPFIFACILLLLSFSLLAFSKDTAN
jgi:MFS family permease